MLCPWPGDERTVKPNFFFHGKSFGFAPRSLFLLHVDSPLREKLAWFVTWKPFDNFILAVIILNSLLLAMPSLKVSAGEHLPTSDPSTWEYHIDLETMEVRNHNRLEFESNIPDAQRHDDSRRGAECGL